MGGAKVHGIPLLAALLALGACGGGEAVGPGGALPAALVGSWQAGSACKAQGCAVTAQVEGSTLQLPLTDSLSVRLDIAAGGSVVSTLTPGGQPARTLQGMGRVRGSTLIIDYPGTPSDTIAWAEQGSLLRFDFQNALQLGDVTGDGVPDRLRISVLFARR